MDERAFISPRPGQAAARGGERPLLPLDVSGLVYEKRGQRIIDALDWRLSASGISVIMGPNGAGKSVLLRLVHGLLRPTAGTISWNGQAMSDDLRRRQGLVFQSPVLLRRTVGANMRFALKLRGLPHDGAAIAAALAPAGLAALAARPAGVLSGGERQRLAMARALALSPQVLMLDEPTVSLDPASTAAVEALVATARGRGVKVILVTHDIGQARRLADDVTFLHRGRVFETTPAAKFFNEPASEAARTYLDGRILL